MAFLHTRLIKIKFQYNFLGKNVYICHHLSSLQNKEKDTKRRELLYEKQCKKSYCHVIENHKQLRNH